MSPTAPEVVLSQTDTFRPAQGFPEGWFGCPSQRTQCVSTPGSPAPMETPPDSSGTYKLPEFAGCSTT